MAELYQQERLQPSLLDRLTDDFPRKRRKAYSAAKSTANTSSQNNSGAGYSNGAAPTPGSGAGQTALDNPQSEPDPDPDASSGAKVQAPRQEESIDRLVINARKLRECVKRDLSWLLNTGSLEDVVDLTEYPLTAQSVLNYGIPDLTGVSVANANVQELERRLKRVIISYEPRILKNTLRVKVVRGDEMSRNALRFEIECDIWGQPAPEHLYLNSEIDLGTGSVNIIARNGG